MNIAYIDGQNLILGAREENWVPDLVKLREYLRDKYNIDKAYYFIGQELEKNRDLYNELEAAGYEVEFKLLSKKHQEDENKGNIDTDLVFAVMRDFVEINEFERVVIVSGDSDFKQLVDYLIKKKRLLKLLAPNGKYSSLYKDTKRPYVSNLSSKLLKFKLKKRKGK
jgi:uncharacterized LabA/DUF88 family protein